MSRLGPGSAGGGAGEPAIASPETEAARTFVARSEEETFMAQQTTLEMQCTHAEFLRELPAACGNRPYEIIGNEVIVHDGTRKVRIKIHDEPIRHLGSLDLPMEEITLTFDDFSDAAAEQFMRDFRRGSQREGG